MNHTKLIISFILTGCLILLYLPAAASQNGAGAGSDDGTQQQGKIWIEEQTGAVLPLDTVFVDENGDEVILGDILTKPTIILPIYFYCPNSCPSNLANLALAIDRMKLRAGKDYRVIALSFNDKETAEQARDAKKNYIRILYEGFPENEWKFLTGSKQSIKAVLDVIGFSFKALKDGTFIHPSVLVTVADDGTIIKYVYGSFIPGDVEIALVEAGKGSPARSVKRLLNYCFNYDPDANNSFFQTTKLVVLALFGGLIAFFFMRFLRKKNSGTSGNGKP